jgi:hypothetical protein
VPASLSVRRHHINTFPIDRVCLPKSSSSVCEDLRHPSSVSASLSIVQRDKCPSRLRRVKPTLPMRKLTWHTSPSEVLLCRIISRMVAFAEAGTGSSAYLRSLNCKGEVGESWRSRHKARSMPSTDVPRVKLAFRMIPGTALAGHTAVHPTDDQVERHVLVFRSKSGFFTTALCGYGRLESLEYV